MKRKILAIVFVVSMLAVQTGLAESLFDLSLFQNGEKAVSYGVSMGKEPVSQQTLPDGSRQETYAGVTEEDFLAFGNVLVEKGYSTVTQNVTSRLYTTDVAKAEMQLSIQYDRTAGSLTVTYPAAVEVEAKAVKDPFEGYTVIEPNVEIKMFDTLRITLDNRISDISTLGALYVYYWRSGKTESANIAIRSSVMNLLTGNNSLSYSSKELPNINFCCINADGSYSYEGFFSSKFSDTVSSKKRFGWSTFQLNLEPLEPATSYILFDLPSAILNDYDPNSIWAVTFERSDSPEKYVLYLDKTLPAKE